MQAVSMKMVAVIVQDGAEPFGLGSMCEVWGEPYHPEDDNPVFDFVVATPRPGRVTGATGFDLHIDHSLADAADADLVCLTPKIGYLDPSPEVVELVRDVHARGATVFAHCSAAFMLGEAGLLDGRRATTHWRHVDELAARYPEALIDGNVLYVQDGTLVTGAGSAAGLDAALHVMRQHFGARVAAATARRMVVPPHFRPTLQGGDRDDALQLDPGGAGAGGPGDAGADRPLDRQGGRRGRLRQHRHPATPLPALARRQPAGVPAYVPDAGLTSADRSWSGARRSVALGL